MKWLGKDLAAKLSGTPQLGIRPCAGNKCDISAMTSLVNLALDEIKSDGTYAQIFSKWIMFSYSDMPESSEKLSADEKELQELSRQIKKLDEKINLILKHLKIPL